uniref:Uncharacterized protein n=1 Tax=Anguilla anguilla TaxID=7936 RepID=A0A0E9QTV7_ANGAN
MLCVYAVCSCNNIIYKKKI